MDKILKNSLYGVYKKMKSHFAGYGLSDIRAIRAVNDFIVSCLKSKFAIVNGHKMFLGKKDSLYLSVEAYEPLETALIKKIIKEGDVILDIGANIGYYTLLFAGLVGEDGKVFAFEPEPENFCLLKKNIEMNGYKNTVLEQKAVSDKNETSRLYLSEKNSGDHRIYDFGKRESIAVDCVKLDDYFKNYQGKAQSKIDFIKMDIQGVETAALSGMKDLLEKNSPIIMMEFWPVGIKRSGREPAECLNMLRAGGYDLYSLNKEGMAGLKAVSDESLLGKYTPENKKYVNLLCVKNGATKEKLGNIIRQ